MRRLLTAAVLTAVALPLAAQPPGGAEKPQKFTSKDGRFAAVFPSTPKVETQTLTVGTETLAMHTTTVEGKGFALLVIWNDMPDSTRDVPAKDLLDGAVKGAANKGKVVEDKTTTFGPEKLPARRIVLDTKDGVRFQILIVLKDRRLYQAMAGGTKEFASSQRAQNFLKSFELVK
jgi:hypothetical protein